MTEYDIENFKRKRRLSIKKKIIVGIVIIVVMLIILGVSLYISDEGFREWINTNGPTKEVTIEDIASIDLSPDKNNQIYAYSKYIAVLNDRTVSIYNSYGENVEDIDVNINTALFDSNGKYLAIAENGGQEICLISDKLYLWSNKIEGEIIQIHVGTNGYIGVVTTDNTNKSIINFFSPDGTPVFNMYFSKTRIVDLNISKDNKKMAVAELDTSGAIIQSNIKIISIDEVQKDAEDAVVYEYNATQGNLVTKVKYQDNDKVICMYDNCIDKIENGKVDKILTIENEKITFMSANMDNKFVYAEETSNGIFNNMTNIIIKNIQNDRQYTYSLEENVKAMETKGKVIAVNVGTEMYFLNGEGSLLRKYKSNQEINEVVLSNNIAGIIYKDKIDIVEL